MNQAQSKAFANAFYKLNLRAPSSHFAVETVPASPEDVTEIQAVYHLHYFQAHGDEFKALDPKEQLLLNGVFEKAGSKTWAIHTTKESLSAQPKEVIQHLSHQYEGDAWHLLAPDYQTAFNKALESHNLPAKELTAQPWSTTKKVAVFAGVSLLIVGAVFGLTWAGLAFRASYLTNNNISDDGQPPIGNGIDPEVCIGDHCTPFNASTTPNHNVTPEELSQIEFTHTHIEYEITTPPEAPVTYPNATLPKMCIKGFEDTPNGCFRLDTTASLPPVAPYEAPKDPLAITSPVLQSLTDSSLSEMCIEGFENTAIGCFQVSSTTPAFSFLHENAKRQPTALIHAPETEESELKDLVTAPSDDPKSSFLSTLKQGFSKYIWNLEAGEVRASYNFEIAQAYQTDPCGKAAFDALKQGTPISKECVQAAVALRDEIKEKHQDGSAYFEWALIQDRQLYEYHFQHAFNKGDYQGALKTLWAGLGQIYETGSANPTMANLEAIGKTPESIACGAFATNNAINQQLGSQVPEVDCREALPKQPKAARGWMAPIVYIAPQVIPPTYLGYKAIQKIVWPILSTLGSLLFCCRRPQKKAASPTYDSKLWTEDSHALSNKNKAPKAFDKVKQLTVGNKDVTRQGPHNRLTQAFTEMQGFFGENKTWEPTLKVIAYMAAHDLLEEATSATNSALSWADVEDQSIVATLTKGADEKIKIVVEAVINSALYQLEREFDSKDAIAQETKSY